MAWKQLANNAKTTLSAGCTDVATAITPSAKTTFPDPEDDGSFYVTIWDADTYPDPGDDPGMEIVLVTADAAANWTVTRGQAGTAGAAHVAGDAVRLLWLAEHAQEIQDAVDLNSTHRTTVDAISGLVSGNGAGGYSGVARANLTGTANQVTLTGDGSNTLLGTAIQLSLPQDIATASTPQFGRLGLGAAAGTARITLVEGTTAADGIDFGGDVNLYRSAANVLKTDDSVHIGGTTVQLVGGNTAVSATAGWVKHESTTKVYINYDNYTIPVQVGRAGHDLMMDVNGGLAVNSTTKAFSPPRMTTTQRDAIASPEAGMVVYNTTTNVLNFYNGSTWGAV